MPGKGPGPKWLARREQVVAMLNNGASTADLAQHFGTTRGGVRTALNRLGLQVPPGTIADERRAKMIAQWACPAYRATMVGGARKGGSRSWRKVLDCVPMPYREEYFRLVKSGVPAKEARAFYKAEWPKLVARALRQIAEVAKPLAEQQTRQHNSFEAQLERVKAGTARVVPTFRPSAHVSNDRSLIGNSSAMVLA